MILTAMALSWGLAISSITGSSNLCVWWSGAICEFNDSAHTIALRAVKWSSGCQK
ncbi:conserved hypothetical protein [Ricinus communis]|uniref:Uncharacterized protein n=1 Tax=Ricinus communis TaxID=3988 RepID=B9T0V1_RICCO|nr:conserved hypothetical protein [Ricinus communis]